MVNPCMYLAGVKVGLEKCRNAIKQFPNFPFTYYALAYCLEKQGDSSWRPYAEKAVAIFEETTVISGHQKSHEQSLAYLKQLLARSR
jgi:Tetratricopeptide repeat